MGVIGKAGKCKLEDEGSWLRDRIEVNQERLPAGQDIFTPELSNQTELIHPAFVDNTNSCQIISHPFLTRKIVANFPFIIIQ